MPKVSNCSFRVDGDVQRFDIHYTKKGLFSVVNFPTNVIRLGINVGESEFLVTSGHATEQALIHKLRDIIDRYHVTKSTSRKVIIFSIEATREIRMNKVGDGSYQGIKDGISQRIGSMVPGYGYGFCIQFDVALEINDNGTKYKSLSSDGSIRHTISDEGKQIIEWTEQREKSFQAIAEGMDKMVRTVSSVMCNDARVLQLLDSGTKLLW